MNRPGHPPRAGRESFALIVSLCFLTLISALILGFILMAQQRRQVAYSGANQNNAALLARSAANILIGELRSEIASPIASTAYESNGIATATLLTAQPPLVFLPKANAYVVPEVRGNPDGSWTNVVKMSRATPTDGTSSLALYTGGRALVAASPSADTATNSLNGRSVDDAAWRLPQLVASGTASLNTRWCIVTRSGVQSVSDADVARLRDPANAAYAIGRFSYIVYDEGGLLDINAAGNGLSAATNGRRAYLNQADLSQIPGIGPQAAALVAWRSPVSSVSAATLFSSTNDYTSVPAGDQIFASRGDLIRYAATNSGTLSPSALPLLTTFTRELNAPSWGPTQNAADQSPKGSSAYSYRDNQNNTALTTANRFTPNVRLSSSGSVDHFRPNGVSYSFQVTAGQPLLQHRFPLGRLNWIGPTGPQNGGTAANVQSCFGLIWDQSLERWTYAGSTLPLNSFPQASIETLAQIAKESAPREPNFFELLQAGILSGSLGLPNTATTLAAIPIYNSAFNQVIQIGVNVIDQWTSTGLPTRILFGGNEFYGSKAIPYISKVTHAGYRPIVKGNPAPPVIMAWDEFEVWNPYNFNLASISNVPQQFQIVIAAGSVSMTCFLSTSLPVPPLPAPPPSPSTPSVTTSPPAAKGDILSATDANLLTDTQDPRFLDTLRSTGKATISGTVANDVWPNLDGSGGSYTGFYLGSATLKAATDVPNGNLYLNYPGIEYDLQYKYPGGWRTVQKLVGLGGSVSYVFPDHDALLTANNRQGCYAVLDPRTLRFGFSGGGPSSVGNSSAYGHAMPVYYNQTAYWSQTDNTQQYLVDFNPTGSTFTPSAGAGGARALFRYADNSGSGSGVAKSGGSSPVNYASDPMYTDLDGVQRYGDASWGSSNPLGPIAANAKDRPFILNGPFQSVADMGYAFRDLPFKSLDFATSRSADAGLLDLFCINDGHTNGVVVGRIDLNTRHPEVIQAALSGTYRSALLATPGAYNSVDAGKLAASLVNLRNGTGANQGPLLNPSELTTRFADTAFVTNGFSEVIKQQKEAAIRTLSSVGQTRTWNLLIDVVAQSGRYPAQAQKLSDFAAEGERRYWVHVAIDRYTGQIVDQQFEPVRN